MKIELAAGNLDVALRAAQIGVHRIELCAALALGGITPQPSTIKLVKEEHDVEIIALIRPRDGNFVYNAIEKKQTLHQIENCLLHGSDGIAIGALTAKREIDINFITQIRKEYPRTSITFHRAFDFTPDPMLSAKQLTDIGIQRILTSGQKPSAWQGKSTIKNLIEQWGSKMVILPGAGINATNALELSQYTKCQELHLSSKKIISSGAEQSPFNTDLWDLDEDMLKKTLSLFV